MKDNYNCIERAIIEYVDDPPENYGLDPENEDIFNDTDKLLEISKKNFLIEGFCAIGISETDALEHKLMGTFCDECFSKYEQSFDI